jgi:hypothetical protein
MHVYVYKYISVKSHKKNLNDMTRVAISRLTRYIYTLLVVFLIFFIWLLLNDINFILILLLLLFSPKIFSSLDDVE